MKSKKIILLVCLATLFACAKSGTSDKAKVLDYSAAKESLFNCSMNKGFEIQYNTNYFGTDRGTYTLGMKDETIWSINQNESSRYNYVVDATVETGSYLLSELSLESYRKLGWINYNIEILYDPEIGLYRVNEQEYRFEIIDSEKSPIISSPSIEDVVIQSFAVGAIHFSVNCEVDYLKLFGDKKEVTRYYFNQYVVDIHSVLFLIQRFSTTYHITFKPNSKTIYCGRNVYEYKYSGEIDGYVYDATGYIDIETSVCLFYETFATRDGETHRYYLQTSSFLVGDDVVVPNK